jgi:hypothetical protein
MYIRYAVGILPEHTACRSNRSQICMARLTVTREGHSRVECAPRSNCAQEVMSCQCQVILKRQLSNGGSLRMRDALCAYCFACSDRCFCHRDVEFHRSDDATCGRCAADFGSPGLPGKERCYKKRKLSGDTGSDIHLHYHSGDVLRYIILTTSRIDTPSGGGRMEEGNYVTL